MRYFILMAAIVALAACSTHTIQTPVVNATSSAFLYCPEALVIQLDGKRVNLGAESSGVGAVVQALGHEAAGVMR